MVEEWGVNKMPQVYVKCSVDDCSRRVMPTSKMGLCPKHEEWMTFLLWAVPRIKIEKKPDDKKLFVPGSEAVKAVMEKK